MKKVQILLSTYNGPKYLTQLMNSLLAQDYPNFDILVRDDGSSDETISILQEFTQQVNVKVLFEKNIGVVKSFFRLLELASTEAEYFAFCDQDDVWESDKISRAVAVLSKQSSQKPVMYFSRLKLVDENLSILGLTPIPYYGASFRNALVQNFATGCTIVINAKARDLMINNLPSLALWHDWWIYLTVSAFGKVVYDEESRVLYRQHADNVVGSESGFFGLWIGRAHRFKETGNQQLITKQAEEFKRIYESTLTGENRAVLDRFISERKTFRGRLKYALSSDVYRQTRLDSFVLRLLIALNRT